MAQAEKQAIATQPNGQGQGLIATMAQRYGLDPQTFYKTIQKTIFPQNVAVSPEQTAAFLMVANHYTLNPFTKEIYAFPAKGGGITPVVAIDGWLKLINSNSDYNGAEFVDHINEDGDLTAITCKIHHKHRAHPIEVTEYMQECRRNTDPWKQWPARMLRHKALIQCARYAFGFAGIVEPDEAERAIEVGIATQPEMMEMPQRKELTQGLEATDAIDVNAEVVDEGNGDPEIPMITAQDRSAIYEHFARLKMDTDQQMDYLQNNHGVTLLELELNGIPAGKAKEILVSLKKQKH